MSKFEIDFSCLEKYQKKLEELGRKGTRIETKALEESADIILDEMVKRLPLHYRTYPLKIFYSS